MKTPQSAVKRVLLAQPHGFCAGVEMAVKALDWLIRLSPEQPVYCYHEIIHNDRVAEAFRKRGVVFVNEISEVPSGAPLMLSAHGASPAVHRAAAERTPILVDATCPLVAKVHREIKARAAAGYAVVYIGHAGHDETLGTLAVAPEATHLVESTRDVGKLPELERVAILTQTTLPMTERNVIRDAIITRFPDAWEPPREDLCYATTNRQTALRALIEREPDAIVVVGSTSSANTASLVKLVQAAEIRALLVNGGADLPRGLSGTIGVTAGASAPEAAVNSVIERLAPTELELVAAVAEPEYFQLPLGIRRRIGPDAARADRERSANDVLKLSAESC